MRNYDNIRMLQLCIAVLVLLQACNALSYPPVQSKDYLVCKPIGSLFEMQQSNTRGNSTPLRGAQGPPGPRGFPGVPGPVGPKAIVDWNKIEYKIGLIIQELTRCPGVVYNGSCFWLPQTVSSKNGQGKSAAERLCRFHNGTLVDIKSEEMYETLYSYVQRAWNMYVDEPTANAVDVWLASRYENEELQSSTGGSVYVRWHSGYPRRSGRAIAWTIPTNPTRVSRIGMFNKANSYIWAVPLCRIKTSN